MKTSVTVYDTAVAAVDAGLSVIPIKADGSKAPSIAWATYQEFLPSDVELKKWFRGTIAGMAVLGGAISGNLLILDFETLAAHEEWRQQCVDNDLCNLDGAPLVETPSGGRHVYLRCSEPVGGNEKLSNRLIDIPAGYQGQRVTVDGVEWGLACKIETRGQGGYVLAPPSGPQCHPAKKPYVLLSGSLSAIPVISPESLDTFLAIARSASEWVEPARQQPAAHSDPGGRPGDEFNERGDLGSILERHGWRRENVRGGNEQWRRPGKSHGPSATIRQSDGVFYCFTSNAPPFEPGRAYSAFSVYAMLEHGGDYKAAAKQLAADGYGSPPVSREIHHETPSMSNQPPVDEVADLEAPITEQLQGMADAEARDGKNGPSDYTLAFYWAQLVMKWWRFCEGDQWWRYHGGYWRYRSNSYAQKDVQDWLAQRREKTKGADRNKVSAALVRNVMALSQSLLGVHDMAEFDADPMRIGLLNGVYDVRTGRLHDHSPDNLVTSLRNFEFDEFADCPLWRSFITETMIDTAGEYCEEWALALQEWFGYCLIPDNRAQVSMFWTGEGGNGKGVAMRLLEKLVGHQATTSIPIEQLHDPYHRADLWGKLVGFVNEPDRKSMQKNGNWFKAITGGEDSISARRPGEKVFNFKSNCRIVVACNQLPATNDPSRAYYRRIVIIDWRFSTTDPDTSLDSKLATELPGIFNWALDGLHRFIDRGYRFAELPESDRLKEGYRMSQDSVSRFAEEELVFDQATTTASKLIYDRYRQWCEDEGIKGVRSNDALGRVLSKRGCVKCCPHDEYDRSFRAWRGVRIATNDISLPV